MPLVGLVLHQPESDHRDDDRRHVRQIVPRIGKQSHRFIHQPEYNFDSHINRIERYTDDEGGIQRTDAFPGMIVDVMCGVWHNFYR